MATRQQGSIKERTPGTWIVQLYKGLDPETKRRIYESKTVHGTEADAEQMLTQMKAKKATQRGSAVATQMSVGELLQIWIDVKEEEIEDGDIARSTWDRYSETIKKHLIPVLGEYKILDITPGQIEDALLAWRKRFSVAYVRIMRTCLVQSFKFARRRNLIVDNPAEGIRLKKKNKKNKERPSKKNGLKTKRGAGVEAMTPAEEKRFLKAAEDTPHYLFFALMLGTGLRVGEACALRWEDVEDGIVEVNATVQNVMNGNGYEWVIDDVKTECSRREVTIGKRLQQLLWQHKHDERVRAEKCSTWQNEELVFHTSTGTMYNRKRASKAIGAIFRAAGLEKFKNRTHILRHTYATVSLSLASKPGSILTVSENLGHSNPSITLDVYSHALPEDAEELTEALDKVLFGKAV